MTTQKAFQGSDSLKQALLERLQAHQAAGHLIEELGVWDGTQGSPSGCTVQGDIELYQTQVGISKALVWLYDWLFMTGDPTDRDDFVLDWLRSIEPGSDLHPVETSFVLWLLTDDEYGAGAFGAGAEIDTLLQTLAELHKRLAAGETPPEQQWRDFRENAVAATDRAEDDRNRALCSLIEVLAWPAGSSFTALTDGLDAWIWAHDIQFTQSEGWNEECDKRLEAIEQAAEEQSKIGDNTYDNGVYDKRYAQMLADAPDLSRIISLREQYLKQLAQAIRRQLLDLLSQAAV
ncbi:hypothetical protein PEC302107_00640 [Pectobacterium araliae]|uniref:Uncharacterized protein n=1 Tax=Pectobacterium araliae TaxID=3073862 RepID=A0AAN0KA60_9GAMM|nr:hypothetical protein PEC302110_03270 [Pectobacterium sp. MAFF 302110]GKW18335.1 hypothetical protein PEC302107_00640 [Pectobacterium carotovorum subsp. carotovorum]